MTIRVGTAAILSVLLAPHAESALAETKADRTYTGISYDIDGKLIKLYRDQNRPFPAPELIIDELEQRLSEAIDQYQSRKGTLPACVRDAVDKLLADLMTGRRTLVIEWRLPREGPQNWSPGRVNLRETAEFCI